MVACASPLAAVLMASARLLNVFDAGRDVVEDFPIGVQGKRSSRTDAHRRRIRHCRAGRARGAGQRPGIDDLDRVDARQNAAAGGGGGDRVVGVGHRGIGAARRRARAQ